MAVFELDDSGEYVNFKFVEYVKTKRKLKPKKDKKCDACYGGAYYTCFVTM